MFNVIKIKRRLKYSYIAAFAGFLFGFDTIVISGVDQKLQELWNSTDLFHGLVVVGMALWGTVIGAIFGGLPTNYFGRKKTLLWIGYLYSISAIGSAICSDAVSFAFFRFLGGVGIGISTIAAPAYISEISASNERGKLVGYYQLNIVIGILSAFVSNFFLKDLGDSSWRFMIGIEAIPAIIYTIMIFYISQSPRWIFVNGDISKSEHIYEELFSIEEKKVFLKEISETKNEFQKNDSIFKNKYRFILYLAFMIAFFNQFSGINAFLYYSPRIFQEGGLGENSAFLSSIGIGITNLIFTIVGISLIDKVGRKVLMIIGSIGYIISLTFIFLSFLFSWVGIILPMSLFLFIAAHAIGQGSVIWVYISEIFPNHIRSSGQSFGTSTHWILAALIPSMIPFLFSNIGASYVFLIFLLMMIFQLIFVVFSMPETKGKSLETLSNELIKR